MKKCTKNLYNGIITILDRRSGLLYKMKKYQEEEVLEIAFRLTDILTKSDLTIQKNELVKLLDRLNELSGNVYEDYEKDLEANKGNQDLSMDEQMTFSYLMGKISILKSVINPIINKITDYELIQ